jgi:hypothetical protein
LDGANQKVEVTELVATLGAGIEPDDEATVETLATMIPAGHYDVHVVEIVPRAVALGTANDYFVHEQQAVWGLDGFWGLPHDPRVPYYRVGDRPISEHSRLFEFVMPMYPRNWLNKDQVSKYRAELEAGQRPTAVAISLLDVKGAAFSDATEFEHWCLAHYVLDGHHKIEAASQAQVPITMVSFLASAHGVSGPEQVERVPDLLDFR